MIRRRRVLRQRRKTCWLSGSNPGCATGLSIERCNGEAHPFDVFTLVLNPADALPGEVNSVSEVTLLRLVGEQVVGISCDPPAGADLRGTVQISEGYFIADTNDAAFVGKDPSNVNDQSSKDWLWRRTSYFTLGIVTSPFVRMNDEQPFGNAHIDVRVKRKVRKQEGIFHAVHALLDSGATSPLIFGAGAWDVTAVVPFAYGSMRALVMLP